MNKIRTTLIPMILVAVMLVGTGMPSLSLAQQAEQTSPDNDYLEMAVLYHQVSSEYRALCYQAYNVAKNRLEEMLHGESHPESLAVVVDIDETVLDNSPYEADLVLENYDYPKNWTEWIELSAAHPIPGALEFLQFADSVGVRIFYVSNRRATTLIPTMENLEVMDFPQVKEKHMYLRTDESSKESRRNKIRENHRIALLIGDNLNDFSDVFGNRSNQDRNLAADLLRKKFGKKFIVLPNPMYGEWEGAIYDYDWSLSDEEKANAREKALKGFTD
ncbi:MAG: 5'-nucleotidase, lipoprotein e(P4) family [Candidatus Marinimicrobia bacterium]|nr:5'-nucleotidase, lipoprotein e(P4) family [Candidatus Neomarinimicrobiota bacterium]MCF7827518.1 5'-nucleotidase, lipoprotein e(P4) family [Candidatus Neomarinimicrobiota bacterium]MCF7881620.1 5'-nucleotidase, lipoprotein e(P4) family [Candidatus Neomarinimicrobiota bacterium]